MTIERRPRWAYLLFPHLALIIGVTILASTDHLRFAILKLPGVDKIGHFVLYGALSFFSVGFFSRTRSEAYRVAAILLVLATLEEFSQGFFPARTVDLGDPAATPSGILLFAHWAAGAVA